MSFHTLRRSAVALFIGILSIVVISAGSATASRLITGKDIKNGTVTGKDIKNKSVGPADLSDAAKQSMTGGAGTVRPAGPAGATGPAGAVGPAGPAGPAALANAYTASLALKGMTDGNSEVLLDKVVPNGQAYVVTAKLILYAVGVGTHTCELRAGGSAIDNAVVTTSAAASKNTLMMTGISASGGQIRVSCTVNNGAGAAQQTKIIATPVGTIN